MKMQEVEFGDIFQWNGSTWIMLKNGDALAIAGNASYKSEMILDAKSRFWEVKMEEKI